MSTTRFSFRIGPRSGPILRLWGVRPDRARVDLDDEPGGEMDALFGASRIRTPIGNIASWRLEGPFRWIVAIGVRRSMRHGDVTFGSSAHGGLRVDFRRPVKFGIFRPPALYVTVDDLDGLAAALTRLGVPGEDARR
jgi:hypothetical protein